MTALIPNPVSEEYDDSYYLQDWEVEYAYTPVPVPPPEENGLYYTKDCQLIRRFKDTPYDVMSYRIMSEPTLDDGRVKWHSWADIIQIVGVENLPLALYKLETGEHYA